SPLSCQLQYIALPAACTELQARSRLDRPPLLAARRFWLGAQRGARLLLAAHHLVIDGVSWRILLDDLRLGLEQLQQGRPVTLPPRTDSFRRWAAALPQLAASPAILSELPFWLAIPLPLPLPSAEPQSPDDTLDNPAVESFVLREEDTSLLFQEAATLHASPEEIMLAALAWGLREWVGPRHITIELESHGRNDQVPLSEPYSAEDQRSVAEQRSVDISRTVGWFTAAFPLCLDLSQAGGPFEALRLVKERMHALPQQGFRFGLLAAYHPNPAVREQLWQRAFPPVSFNFLGTMFSGQLGGSQKTGAEPAGITIANEDRGPESDPRNGRSAQIDINGGVMDGELRLEFTYASQIHPASTIRRLVEAFSDTLRCYLHTENGRAAEQVLSATDFPLANLDQKKFAKIMTKIKQSRGKVS
ncbi:MAG: hypothetical protein EHM21_13610, partial [Chloroflexi bacterium]